ncbi:MAG: polysaccharide deacetylase family protein, partial [Deltaproteobacteria bacterium]|nr:polysaccharide deacetylase family protein [Deltaproteobacteria bacterium]
SAPASLCQGVPLSLFEGLCEHLSQHYQVLPLEELERLRQAGRVPARAVALTFDDGYADNYRLAFPVLKRYGLPATIFVTTDFLNRRAIPWATKLQLILEHAEPPDAPPVLEGVPISLETFAARERSYVQLVDLLQHAESKRKHQQIDILAEELGVDVKLLAETELITWDQLVEMDAEGFTAGGHTITHPFLTRIPAAQVERELRESKAELESRLGHAVRTLAYPNGKEDDFSPEVVAATEAAGYELAVTALFGANSRNESPYTLRRVSLDGPLNGVLARLERYYYYT